MLARSTWRLLAREAAEALLPQRCLVCRRFGSALHDRCVKELPAAEPPRCAVCWAPRPATVRRRGWRCARCGLSSPSFAALRAPFRFSGPARRALLEAKFRGVTRLLEPLAAAAAAIVPRGWGPDVVVPVPLHAGRQRRRGYNQSELAARTVARSLGLPLDGSLLLRVRPAPPQAGLSAEERLTNLRDVYAGAGLPPERVLLVDDVTTTGATFEAAAAALRRAGAGTVYALALARED